MNFRAIVKKVLPLQTGTSKYGPWKKQDLIVETEGKVPRLVCVKCKDNQIELLEIKEGDLLVIHFELESREYNGNWYTQVKAWKIDKILDEISIDM